MQRTFLSLAEASTARNGDVAKDSAVRVIGLGLRCCGSLVASPVFRLLVIMTPNVRGYRPSLSGDQTGRQTSEKGLAQQEEKVKSPVNMTNLGFHRRHIPVARPDARQTPLARIGGRL